MEDVDRHTLKFCVSVSAHRRFCEWFWWQAVSGSSKSTHYCWKEAFYWNSESGYMHSEDPRMLLPGPAEGKNHHKGNELGMRGARNTHLGEVPIRTSVVWTWRG